MSKKLILVMSIVLSALMGSWTMAFADDGLLIMRRGNGGGGNHGGGIGRGGGRGGNHGGSVGRGGGNHGGGKHNGGGWKKGRHNDRHDHNRGGWRRDRWNDRDHGGWRRGGYYRNRAWSCTVSGKNRRGNLINVRGGVFWDQFTARNSAYNRCVNSGLRNCRLVICAKY